MSDSKDIQDRLRAIELKLEAIQRYMEKNREASAKFELDTEDYDELLQQFQAISADVGGF